MGGYRRGAGGVRPAAPGLGRLELRYGMGQHEQDDRLPGRRCAADRGGALRVPGGRGGEEAAAASAPRGFHARGGGKKPLLLRPPAASTPEEEALLEADLPSSV